jgi:methylphosphotriester-DNA--protein-cysteine methyltransferase
MNKLMEIQKLAAATTGDPRWQSILMREEDADGKFFYSVGTTGVYCRTILCRTSPETRKRALPRDHRRCRAGRISRLQALQAHRTLVDSR